MSEKVALMADINQTAHEVFKEAGFEIVTFPKKIETPEFIAVTEGASFIGIRSGPRVPAEVIKANPELIAIGCFAVQPNVDFEAANEEGVPVVNAEHENTRSVAEHVITVTGALFRRTAEHNQSLHQGVWSKTEDKSYEMRRKVMGIVGYGVIGSQVAVLAEGMGFDVLYYDEYTKFPPYGRAERVKTLEELLNNSDVVTLHVPDIPTTKHMINAKTLKQMKKGSYLVNAARDSAVDYGAFMKALDAGHIAGAAFDVFPGEPAKRGEKFMDKLRLYDNVILTPHIGGSTQEAQTSAGTVVADKLVHFGKTGDYYHAYRDTKLPRITPGILEEDHSRLVCVHDDEPGTLASINKILGEAGTNITSSAHKTAEGKGIVWNDVEGVITPELLQKVRDLGATRRAFSIP